MSSIYSIIHLQPTIGDTGACKEVASELARRYLSIPLSDIEQYVRFFTNPAQFFTEKEFVEIQYMFVGEYDAEIALILEEIEHTQSLSKIDKATLARLSGHFGYDVTAEWTPFLRSAKKHKNRRIRFAPYQILPDDSIQLIYNIVTAVIPSTTFEQLYMFADRGESWASNQVAEEDIQQAVLLSMNQYINRMKGKGRKIQMESMQLSNDDILEIMRLWSIPRSTLMAHPYFSEQLQNGRTWSYRELIELIHTPELMTALRLRLRIAGLSHQWSMIHRTIPYLSLPMPLMYLADKSDADEFIRKYREESVVDTKYEFRLNQKGYVSVLRDMLPRFTEESTKKTTDVTTRTIYMYSLGDIPGARSMDVGAETTWIRKFFPQWTSSASSKLSITEHTELKESLKTYNAISSSMERGAVYSPSAEDDHDSGDLDDHDSGDLDDNDSDDNAEEDHKSNSPASIVQVRDVTCSFIELQYKLHMHADEYDVLSLFNQYPLSIEYPFVTLRDPATKENVYKVFKGIAQVASADVEPYVSRREMERWFQYTNYIYENTRMRPIRDIVRGIHCKVLWYMGRLETFERRGVVESIDKKAHTCTIFGNGKYYRDVPMTAHFITRKYTNTNTNPTADDKGIELKDTTSVHTLKYGDDVSFYIPQRKFIDIDVDTRGTVHIRAPVTDSAYQNRSITELTQEVARIGRRWINALTELTSPPATSIWKYTATDEYNALQIRQNGLWLLPIASPVSIMNNAYQLRISMPKEYPIIYHNFISVLKQMYSHFIVNESVMKVKDEVDMFNSDIDKWIQVKVTGYDIDSDSYTVIERFARNPREYTDVRRNYLRYSKDTKQSSFIQFTYRKVSDFSLLTPVQQCILRLNQNVDGAGMQTGGAGRKEEQKSEYVGDSEEEYSEEDEEVDYESDMEGELVIGQATKGAKKPADAKKATVKKDTKADAKKEKEKQPLTKEEEIIAEIKKQFNLTEKKAREAYDANKNTSKVAYVHRETGTDIQFDYIQPVESGKSNIYTFYIHNSHSTDEVAMIRGLLVHLLNLYIAYTYPRAVIGDRAEIALQPIKNQWTTKKTKTRAKSAAEKELEAGIVEMIEERAGAFFRHGVEDIGIRIETRADEFDEVDLESLLMENEAFGTSEESEDLQMMVDDEVMELSDEDREEMAEMQRRELRYGEEVAEEKKAEVREEEGVAKEGIKQKKMGVKKTTTASTILQRLYDVDTSLFTWEQTDKKGDERGDEPSLSLAVKKKGRATQQKNYSRTCQSIDRQPKVLSEEEFKKQNPSAYAVKMRRRNDDGKVTEIEPRVCDMDDPEFRKYVEQLKKEKENPKKKKGSGEDEGGNLLCSAVKWGSTAENQNWYICPRVFDTKKQQALTTDDIEYQKGTFKPMDIKKATSEEEETNAWRTDESGKDLMEYKPRTKGTHYEPLTTDNTENARPIDALFIQNSKKSMKSYVYPGFMDAKNHWQNMYSPCCYESGSVRAIDAFSKTKTAVVKHTEYFLQWGKQLEMGRYGYVASDLLESLGIDNPCKKTNKYDCVMRVNMGTDSYSFVRMMARIAGMYPLSVVSEKEDRTHIDRFLAHVISNLKNDRFTRLNRGQLKHEFNMGTNISELQNYIEYLVADTPHRLSHLYDLFTSPNVITKVVNEVDASIDKGIRLLIIEYTFHPKNKTYSYRMVVPYYRTAQNSSVKKMQKYVVALKPSDKEHYELLEYNQSPIIDNWPNIDMSLLKHHVKKMDFLIERSTHPFYQTAVPMEPEWAKMLQDAQMYSNIFTLKDAREALVNIGDGLARCVYDSNKVIGVYSDEQKVMIPVYPVELSADMGSCPIKTRISLEDLYLNATTMLRDYNQYWDIVNEVCKRASPKKSIEVRHLYRLPNASSESTSSRSDDMRVSGFMSQYGVYVPIKPTRFSDLPSKVQKDVPWKTDAMDADLKIRKTTEATFNHRLYGDRNSIDTLKWYITNGHMKVNKVVVDSLTPTKNEQIIGFVLKNGIYVPVRYYDPRVKYSMRHREESIQSDEPVVYYHEQKWLDSLGIDIHVIHYIPQKKGEDNELSSSTSGVWNTDDDINTYMNKVEAFYTALSKDEAIDLSKYPIYFRPMRMYSHIAEDDTMIVSGLILQTGDRIMVTDKNSIPMSLAEKNDKTVGFIRDFYQKPVVHKLLMDKWVVINSSNVWISDDKRILSNRQFQYHQELYETIIERLNQFLKEPAQHSLRDLLISFLEDSSISTERKMRLIRPVYVSIMQACIRFTGMTGSQNQPYTLTKPVVYIWNIYFNNWGMNMSMEDIWTHQFGFDEEEYKSLSMSERANKIYELYNDHFESEVDGDLDVIKGILKVYRPWVTGYLENEDDYEHILVDTQYIRSEEVLEKIYNDLVKNNVVRNMILYEFSASSRVGRYHHNGETELLVTEHDRWLAQIIDMYKTVSRAYYRQLRTLTEIDYDTTMTIEINEGARLRGKNIYT